VRCVVILNQKAGRPGKIAPGTSPDELRAAFARVGVEAEIRMPTASELNATVRAAAADRPEAVVVGGGDGTVRCAAEALAGSGVTLGVLPLGTLNHFAKDLQIPVKLEEAIALLAAGATREVDVGEVNGHVFINNCSLGAYAEAVRRRDRLREKHGLGKWWAMIRASLDEFRRLRRLRLRIGVTEDRGRTTEDGSEVGCVVPTRRGGLGTSRPTGLTSPRRPPSPSR
jgi:diacylglycerol kinase family enzyme